MPDAAKVAAILRRASMLSRATSGRKAALVTLDDSARDVIVMGDLHGNLHAFRQLLKEADLERNPHRHMVLQELIHGKWFYPDEAGDKSHQLVDVVAALKCQHPQRVHIILGNHELSELTGRSIIKEGVALNELFLQGVRTAYGASTEDLLKAYHEFFSSFPLAVRTQNRVLMVHTIPDEDDVEKYKGSFFEQSGPWPDEESARGGRVYAVTWGRDTRQTTADTFAQYIDADLLITGHIKCENGFSCPNNRQIILDGTDPNPTYTLFPASGAISLEDLVKGAKVLPLAL